MKGGVSSINNFFARLNCIIYSLFSAIAIDHAIVVMACKKEMPPVAWDCLASNASIPIPKR